ncbi:YesL family protein [Promicromonospora iranensis]|uniref:Membrane protein YesL n=1 Tax=Promicromonospora iranensis TaxID=1105144 RepID=A0ABU2CNF6_9MICO|nr:YesL family protein [Promicromonospora iranensis]MDR7382872.1 putative membrane protein YesL [Promicromonospora iranensis]
MTTPDDTPRRDPLHWPTERPAPPAGRPEFGEGPLSRVTNAIYWYLVTGLLMILTTLPGTLPLLLLDRSPRNAPLVALCLVPWGPAFSAGLYGLRDRLRAEGLTPARSFFRGYRQNWADVLRVWVPALVAGAVLGVTLGNFGATGVPDWYAGILLGVFLVLLLWCVNALVITSFFNFRTRDVARLSMYYLFRLPLVTLGTLSLLVLAGGVVYLATEVAFAVLSVLWVAAVLRNAAKLLRDVEERFTAPDAD